MSTSRKGGDTPGMPLVRRVFDALVRGELERGDLSARKLAAFLGQSTIVLYHHFGSLDGFLIHVDGLGWTRLLNHLQGPVPTDSSGRPARRASSTGGKASLGLGARGARGTGAIRPADRLEAFETLALRYVEFAEAHPTLYWLMSERAFERSQLRAQGRLGLEGPLLSGFAEMLRALGSKAPEHDTLVAFAAMHGLVSLLHSGRLDLGPGQDAHARVRAAARRLAALLSAGIGQHGRAGKADDSPGARPRPPQVTAT